MTANNTQVAGLFNVLKVEEVPTKISRARRGGSQWAEAINVLRGLEVGQALSLTVESKNAVNSTRQNMIQANRTYGQGMQMATRTRTVTNDEGEEIIEIFFIKTGDGTVSDDDA